MSDQEDRNREVREISNALMLDRFAQQLGTQARVERSDIENERMTELREVLAAIGRDLEAVGAVPKGMQYCGSLSVHVFKSEVLRTAAFATVNAKEKLDIALADGALRELTNATMESYGQKRKKLRSGF